MGQKLSPRDRELHRRCDEVLHYIWDPIGVSDAPAARDEYESHLPQVFALVRNGANPGKIAQHLRSLETGPMGLSGAADGTRKVADISSSGASGSGAARRTRRVRGGGAAPRNGYIVARRTMDYPIDADGDALRAVARDGSDMTRPMDIDFAVAVPDEASGLAVAKLAADRGYRPSVERDSESGAWSCYCTRSMVPTYVAVIDAQAELDRLAKPVGGASDGWGTFGNAGG